MRWFFSKLVFSSFESFTSVESMADGTRKAWDWSTFQGSYVVTPVASRGLFTLSHSPSGSSLFFQPLWSQQFFVYLICQCPCWFCFNLTPPIEAYGKFHAILLHGSRLSDRNILGNIGKKVMLGLFIVAPRQISKIQTFWGSLGIRSLIRFQGLQMMGVSSRQHRLFHVFVYDMKDISTILNCTQIKTWLHFVMIYIFFGVYQSKYKGFIDGSTANSWRASLEGHMGPTPSNMAWPEASMQPCRS